MRRAMLHHGFLCLMMVSPLHAYTIHVPADSTTIQGGIAGAATGDTVMIDPGVYSEHEIDFLGKAITVMGTDPEDSLTMASTVVDADSQGSVLVFRGGEDSSSVLAGLTLTGGVNDWGGGIRCTSSPTIRNNTITNNHAVLGGGVMVNRLSTPVMENNTIVGNAASNQAGWILCSIESSGMVINTILWDNEAPTGPEIFVGKAGYPSTLAIGYSDLDGGLSSVAVADGNTLEWGDGMIDVVPLFRDPGAGDFHLVAVACGDTLDSPCMDAGTPAVADTLLDCAWGLGTFLSDIGAYSGGRSAQPDYDNRQ